MRERRIVKGDNIASKGPRKVIQVNDSSAHAFVREGAAGPTIECIKEGNVVRYIDIRCACGQVTRLVCDYDEVQVAQS